MKAVSRLDIKKDGPARPPKKGVRNINKQIIHRNHTLHKFTELQKEIKEAEKLRRIKEVLFD